MPDIVIIGSGAAGISAASALIRKKQKAILIEKDWKNFGGVCLNYGCIPTKFFSHQSLHKSPWLNTFEKKERLLENIKTSLYEYLKKSGIEIIFKEASFFSPSLIKAGDVKLKPNFTIICSGSLSNKFKPFHFEGKILSPEEVFSSEALFDKILIIGAGYIGVEFASLFNTLGKEVLIIEKEKTILKNMDTSLSRRLKIILERKGIKIETEKCDIDFDLDDFDLVIPAVGRRPNTESLCLDAAGIEKDDKGWIKVDNFLRTSNKNIFACGDVIGKFPLAYVGEYEAEICVENILGARKKPHYANIPLVVFSHPALGVVGITENRARRENIKYKVIKSNFLKFSSSYVWGDEEGFIQLIIDAEDRLIGAEVISNYAAEIINFLTFFVHKKSHLKELKEIIPIHPSILEIIPKILKS